MDRLGIDIDGCLGNFTKAYGELLAKVCGEDRLHPGWATDPAFPSEWDWDRTHYPDAIADAWNRHILKDGTFWQQLEPLDGAKETVRALNLLSAGNTPVYFLTNRAGYRAKRQTEAWLYDLGMHYPTVILVEDKWPVIKALGLTHFIDDRLITMNGVAKELEGPESIENPLRDRLFLKDAPYNRGGRHGLLLNVGSVGEMLKGEGLWRPRTV